MVHHIILYIDNIINSVLIQKNIKYLKTLIFQKISNTMYPKRYITLLRVKNKMFVMNGYY